MFPPGVCEIINCLVIPNTLYVLYFITLFLLCRNHLILLCRSYNVLQGSPLVLKLVPAACIIIFAVWGIGPLLRESRNILLHVCFLFLSFPFHVIYHNVIDVLPYVSKLSTVYIIEFSNISCRRMIVAGKRVEHIML